MEPSQPIPPDALVLTSSTVPPDSVFRSINFPFAVSARPISTIPNLSYSKQFKLTRCEFCKAYLNPYIAFNSDRSAWNCSLCHRDNVITSPLSEADMGQIASPAYETAAPPDYILRAPVPPTYLFIIDVLSSA